MCTIQIVKFYVNFEKAFLGSYKSSSGVTLGKIIITNPMPRYLKISNLRVEIASIVSKKKKKNRS